MKSNKVNKKLFNIVDHIIVDSDGDYKQDINGLSDYVEIKYAFEEQGIVRAQAIWKSLLILWGVFIVVWLLILLIFVLVNFKTKSPYEFFVFIVNKIALPFMIIATYFNIKTIYKVNFFEVKVYKNSQLVKELNAFDCQCMYFKATNARQINDYNVFVEFIVSNLIKHN